MQLTELVRLNLAPGQECIVELPANARVLQFIVQAQTSPIVEQGRQRIGFLPFIEVLRNPEDPTVPRRFALLPLGSLVPDEAIHIASLVGTMAPDVDLFEIPPGIEAPKTEAAALEVPNGPDPT